MKKILASTAVSVLVMSGCATVTGGSHETVSVKTQRDSQDVAGASCTLQNKGGSYQVTTPGKVEVKRSSSDLTIQCEKDGVQTAAQTYQSKTRKGALAGNLILFGVGGTLIFNSIDRATGANYAYPEEITVSLDPAKAATPADAASAVAVPAETDSTSAKVQGTTTAETNQTDTVKN